MFRCSAELKSRINTIPIFRLLITVYDDICLSMYALHSVGTHHTVKSWAQFVTKH